MTCERPHALNLLLSLGRRIGFRLDLCLGHCDPVKELSLRLLTCPPQRILNSDLRAGSVVSVIMQ